jgi:hypothetical protein
MSSLRSVPNSQFPILNSPFSILNSQLLAPSFHHNIIPHPSFARAKSIISKKNISSHKFVKNKIMKQMFLLLAAAITLTFSSCNDDDNGGGGPAVQPTGTITAELTTSAGAQNPNWSLPVVTARMSFFNITFTARNSDTGETLILNMANNGVGTYYSEMIDVTVGGANYFSDADSEAEISLILQDQAFMLVEITSIDTVAKVMDATFAVWVFADDSTGAPNTILQNGLLVNVPYTGDAQAVSSGGNSSISATVDGAPYQSAFITAFDQYITVQFLSGTVTGESLSISIPYTLKSGTYSLAFGPDNLESPLLATYGAGTAPAIASEGTITLERNFITQRVTGTFSFIALNVITGVEYNVTNGVIDASY